MGYGFGYLTSEISVDLKGEEDKTENVVSVGYSQPIQRRSLFSKCHTGPRCTHKYNLCCVHKNVRPFLPPFCPKLTNA